MLNTQRIFGGAERRFTNLCRYFYEKYPENAYYFVSYDLYYKIQKIYNDYPLQNVIPIGSKKNINKTKITNHNQTKRIDSNTVTNNISFVRKTYRFLKNYKIQYELFKEIEKYQRKYNINVFLGVYSGAIPLYFYLKNKKRKVGVIFTDMDSWFSDIYSDNKKFWYKKYSSFNYVLEKSDIVDFLSPFILKGVKERGIEIEDEKVSTTKCSFADYSKCKVGNKSKFQVAFAGRLEKDKNPELFLDAAILLSVKYPEIVFHIMGEGRLSELIKKRVAQAQNNNIIFHGFIHSPTDILADSSVFVSLQTTNNYPSQSVLEAMACGNAIIATDVGDTRMFINEKNGLLINLDKNELINAIEALYLNREKTEAMGEYAAKYVRENHTIEKTAEYYLKLFEKAYYKIERNA